MRRMKPLNQTLAPAAIDLHFRKGWTYQKIGDSFGVSRSVVAGLIHRHRKSRISPNAHLAPVLPRRPNASI